jgi:outer membrane protein assembly factor BamB
VRVRVLLFALLLAVVCGTSLVGDEHWNRFRGPNGSGVSTATTIPTTWTDTDYNWQVDLPGGGASSPVVWGDKLFVTAADAAKLQRMLLCYSCADGKLLWSQAFRYTKDKKHTRNTYASNTPAVDAERVYTLWQSPKSSQLLAYDHGGQEVWRIDLGPYQSGHGGGLSPIVVDGLVVVNHAHEGNSFLLGVDAATGKERWRVPRERIKASYSTPCVFTDASGQQQLIFTSWKQGITSIDPATGSVLWERGVFEPDDIEKRCIGSPVVSDGVIYGTCGFTTGRKLLVALAPAASAQGSDAKELFRVDRGVTHMPSPLVHAGRVYSWTDAGVVYCFDAKTGETIWQKRLGGNFSGSPICIDGKLYCLSEDEEMVVIATGDKFQELGRVQLDSGSSSTPAVSGGVLYFRTAGKLYSLGGK